MAEFVNGLPVIDVDDRFAEVSIAASGSGTSILSFRTKPGKKAYLVGYGQAWDTSGDRQITVRLKTNGAPVPNYEKTTVQLTPPERAGTDRLPVAIPLEQNALLEVTGDNADASNAYYATARLIVHYTDQPK